MPLRDDPAAKVDTAEGVPWLGCHVRAGLRRHQGRTAKWTSSGDIPRRSQTKEEANEVCDNMVREGEGQRRGENGDRTDMLT